MHRALEPDLDLEATADSIELDFVSLPFEYADGAHNAETLLVDPETADLYVITKSIGGNSAYVARAPHSASASNVLEPLVTLALPEPELATGGDIAADGSLILIRAYGGVFGWPRAAGESIAQALSGTPCVLPVGDEPQGEAIALGADVSGYYTIGEGSGVPVYRVDFADHGAVFGSPGVIAVASNAPSPFGSRPQLWPFSMPFGPSSSGYTV